MAAESETLHDSDRFGFQSGEELASVRGVSHSAKDFE
jgi:hypothetical protein